MKDFLEHLINRSLESKPLAVQPRLPSWYESQTITAAPPLSTAAQDQGLDALNGAPQLKRDEQIVPTQPPTVNRSGIQMRPQAEESTRRQESPNTPNDETQEQAPSQHPKTQAAAQILPVKAARRDEPINVLPIRPPTRPDLGSETPVSAQLPAGRMSERRSHPLQSEKEGTASNPAKETRANLPVSTQPQTAHVPEPRLLPAQGEQESAVNSPTYSTKREIPANSPTVERLTESVSTITPKLPEMPTARPIPNLVRVAEEQRVLTRIVENERASQTDSHRGSEEQPEDRRAFVTDLRPIDQTASTPPVVRIQIRRVDVRVTRPDDQTGQQKKHAPRSPRVSLDAYLKERATTPSTGEKR